ncbi:MAG: SRPBCC family protein [Archangiaceae bacterium]|nr:SRPBCC family protein [Archangiaceae bacterium]
MRARLEAGEVVITTEPVAGSELPRAIAEGVIDAPPEKVWAMIEDCGTYPKNMPRIKTVTVLERDAGTQVCRTTADAPFPIGDLTSETRAVMTVEPGVRWERKWSFLKGDYTANSGSWVLTPYQGDGKRTDARYQIHVEPKLHVPNALVTSAQKSGLKDLFARLRERAVSR